MPGLDSSIVYVGSLRTRQRDGPVCLTSSIGSTRFTPTLATSVCDPSATAVIEQTCGPDLPATTSRLSVFDWPAGRLANSASMTWPCTCVSPSLNLACRRILPAVPVPVLVSLIWNGTFSPTRVVSGPVMASAIFGRVTRTRASTAVVKLTTARLRTSPSSSGLTVTLIRFSAPDSSAPIDQASRSPAVSAGGVLPRNWHLAGNSSSTRTLATAPVPTLRTTSSYTSDWLTPIVSGQTASTTTFGTCREVIPATPCGTIFGDSTGVSSSGLSFTGGTTAGTGVTATAATGATFGSMATGTGFNAGIAVAGNGSALMLTGSGFGSGSDGSTLTEGGSGGVGLKYGGAPAASVLPTTRTSPGPATTGWVSRGTPPTCWTGAGFGPPGGANCDA